MSEPPREHRSLQPHPVPATRPVSPGGGGASDGGGGGGEHRTSARGHMSTRLSWDRRMLRRNSGSPSHGSSATHLGAGCGNVGGNGGGGSGGSHGVHGKYAEHAAPSSRSRTSARAAALLDPRQDVGNGGSGGIYTDSRGLGSNMTNSSSGLLGGDEPSGSGGGGNIALDRCDAVSFSLRLIR
jgi:hypothetical protein